jgi:integrase
LDRGLQEGRYDLPNDHVLRHTFVAWALTIGIDTGKLERLMGHGSKSMIYEVYGKYVEGLEKDRDKRW